MNTIITRKDLERNLRRGKSLYRKADTFASGGVTYLRSYDTTVAAWDSVTGDFFRLWGGYSATTMRHIDAFARAAGLGGMNKKAWDALEVTRPTEHHGDGDGAAAA